MIPALAPLAEFWKQRDARERSLLAAAGAVLALSLIYALAIDPVMRERKRLEQSLPTLRADVARFARDLAQFKGRSTAAASAPDLAGLAQAAGLPAELARIEKNDKRSSLHAQGVNWQAVTRLLGEAETQGWKLEKLSTRTPDGGATVDVDAEWTR